MHSIDEKTKKIIVDFQRNEVTEYYIYKALSRLAKNEYNRTIIKKIADEELLHYHIWHRYSQEKVKPNNIKRWFYIVISTVFGLSFGVKLMERGESNAQDAYTRISHVVPEAKEIQREEAEHESQLINMIEEEKLVYMGSVVLGLNDALVEFTGALAGFTFALQNARLIGTAGLIMGLSASLSMAASEYLSTKAEAQARSPAKASLYTGVAYAITVLLLVVPYLIFSNYYLALMVTIACAIMLILIFTFYFSVVKEIPFRGRFIEMLIISMGVATLSFIIGIIVRAFLHIDV